MSDAAGDRQFPGTPWSRSWLGDNRGVTSDTSDYVCVYFVLAQDNLGMC